ncbi:MAG: hypothetical protein A2428_15660 [Bdellovibrionales bacterium RIFOXYC1_FULL_54_43]|nr:MAG: hypothetical protein A2428_15660 [Bdellovibrionales bacterium RIFOXYC1_FULL_54_43]OFZ78531.1 MAG: hypothetical protein A2603_01740 [Bdellovibrionales bacterium RIFOXYD1_FULL_55_31]
MQGLYFPGCPVYNDGMSKLRIAFYLYDNVDRKFIPLQHDLICGRTEGDLQFPEDTLLSRKHCLFSVQGQVVTIRDLNSTNRTRVNSLELQPGKDRRLQINDVIELGKRRLILTHQKQFPPANIQDRLSPEFSYQARRKSDGSLTSQITRIITKKTLILLNPKTYRDLQIHEFTHLKGWDSSTGAVAAGFTAIFVAIFGALAWFGALNQGLPNSGFLITIKAAVIWGIITFLVSLWHYLTVRKRRGRRWIKFLFIPLWILLTIAAFPIIDGFTSITTQVSQNLTVYHCVLRFSPERCHRLADPDFSGFKTLPLELREKIERRIRE